MEKEGPRPYISMIIAFLSCTLWFLEKTIEGTAAGITSVLAACSVLLPVLASAGFIFTQVSFFSAFSAFYSVLRVLDESITAIEIDDLASCSIGSLSLLRLR